MQSLHPSLFIEINNLNYIFLVGTNDENNNFKINYKLVVPLQGIEKNIIFDLEKACNCLKDNIYNIEQNLNLTFKEVILILENFNPLFVNLSGFKNLNGSQILRENITYILNILKSSLIEEEKNKTVLHMFNSKFTLDKKKIDNLPIGLFGDFYSHELSFTLINSNDLKNLNNIFDKCNLKIKKILLKSFVKGAYLSNNNLDTETFFQVEINPNTSKIFYFENNSLKFEQNFNFGFDIIIKDISKITSLKKDTVNNILCNTQFDDDILDTSLVEKELFKNEIYRKIKKKLIYEIISARIKEFSEIMIFKNINLKYYNTLSNVIFLDINKSSQFKNLKEIYRSEFSLDEKFIIKIFEDKTDDEMFQFTSKLVHYGWKKEAIPVTQNKKSIIARLFDAVFS